ncbi:MAG: helix-turn-helix transcriptional regulator [Candidatus Pacebacteria bacterium]|nr:helix-turn-helix transcriptional regulator [Candidatus Paceibacterota bacterium]
MKISKRPPNHLRRYRKQAGLQQSQVAEMLGLKSTALISRWENNFSYPDLINAFKLAVAYGVMVDALYFDLREAVREDVFGKAPMLGKLK